MKTRLLTCLVLVLITLVTPRPTAGESAVLQKSLSETSVPNTVLSGAAMVSAGMSHTCAVTTGGGAKCWGWNLYGQFGNGNNTDSNVPVDVTGLTSGIAAVSAGTAHTCALTIGGGVKCWGFGRNGQLGNGNDADSNVPVDVTGLASGVQALDAGSGHTCALTTGGGVKCWGQNSWGQLGNGSTISSTIPVDVSGLTSGVSAISAGWDHTCALTTDGGAKCWGYNYYGQLGNGLTANSSLPVDVSGLTSGVSAISAGWGHTCAVTTGGGAKCWGNNYHGELGNGSNTDSHLPVDVLGLTNGVLAVSAGGFHTCAVSTSSGTKCWGRNDYGQLGNGNNTSSNVPVDVSGLVSGVAAVSAGRARAHTCALTTGGGVKCWGYNLYGQLGNGNFGYSPVPIDVLGLTNGVLAVSAGGFHTCAVSTSSGTKCWGRNDYGQLGNGNNNPSNVPVDVSGLTSGVAAVSPGDVHTCAVTTGGGAKCWGNNSKGQLGNGSTISSTIPVDVSGLSSGIMAITAGGDRDVAQYHTCALTNSGGVKCWGANIYGQLGNGTFVSSTIPVEVSGLSNGVTAISAGGTHTCAQTTGGGIKCWGYNNYGQLGNGTYYSTSYIPVDVTGLTTGVAAISAGWQHTCAVTTGGGVKCWGWNWQGQLGNGTLDDSHVPVDVSGLTSGVAAVSAGNLHTCAVTTGGGVKCWGWNRDGQLGTGSIYPSLVPVDVMGLTNGVAEISAGGHSCAVTTGGGAKCWGWNLYGQLGNGTFGYSNVPVGVIGFAGEAKKHYLPLIFRP